MNKRPAVEPQRLGIFHLLKKLISATAGRDAASAFDV